MVFDKAGIFIKKWGVLGAADGELNSPIDIDIDGNGNIYVAEKGNNRIQKFTNDGIFIWKLEGIQTKLFKEITSIAINKSGDKLIVSDHRNSKIHYFKNLNKVFSAKISIKRGKHNKRWIYKRGIAFDAFENIIFSDAETGNIYKYNSSGLLIQTIIVNNTSSFGWDRPERLTVDKKGKIYVLNSSKLKVYTSGGTQLFDTSVGKNNKDNLFLGPNYIAVDKNGYLYVSNEDKFTIEKINPDGTPNKSWGNTGPRQERLFYPQGIAIDKNNDIYIKSSLNVNKYTSEGTFLLTWPLVKDNSVQSTGILKIDKNGNLLIPYYDKIRVYSPEGNLLSTIITKSYPALLMDFAVDSLNNIYVLERTGCVTKYSSSGTELNNWCAPADLGFSKIYNYVNTITIDDSGYVYIVYSYLPSGYHQIYKFNGDMEVKAQFGEGPDFGAIRDITVDKNGKVYIADWSQNRILMYVPDYTAPTPLLRKTSSQESTDTYIDIDIYTYLIEVYPNPSTGSFTISTADDDAIEQIILTNLTGQQEIFYTKTITTTLKGLLLVDIKSTKGRSVKKIIVE